jgi:hypothetical protein
MEYAMDDDSLDLHLVYEAIRSNDELAKTWIRRVGEGAAALAELGQGIPGITDSLGNRCSKAGRVLGNELNRLDQIIGGGLRPDYFASHLESRLLTSE